MMMIAAWLRLEEEICWEESLLLRPRSSFTLPCLGLSFDESLGVPLVAKVDLTLNMRSASAICEVKEDFYPKGRDLSFYVFFEFSRLIVSGCPISSAISWLGITSGGTTVFRRSLSFSIFLRLISLSEEFEFAF